MLGKAHDRTRRSLALPLPCADPLEARRRVDRGRLRGQAGPVLSPVDNDLASQRVATGAGGGSMLCRTGQSLAPM
jgi:hypothetical protein